jgi:hypothetical protein
LEPSFEDNFFVLIEPSGANRWRVGKYFYPSPFSLVARSILLVLNSVSKRKVQICRELLTGYDVLKIRNTIQLDFSRQAGVAYFPLPCRAARVCVMRQENNKSLKKGLLQIPGMRD